MRIAYVFTLLAVILIAAPLYAEGPVALRDDSRLQAKVTLCIACEPLSAFTETLKKATGVTITVKKDIADLNVTAYATDIPAYEAMSRVALVFGCAWEIIGESPGKYGYTLFRPLKKKQEADSLRQACWNEQDQKFMDAIEDAIKLVGADQKTLQEEARKNPGQVAENLMFKRAIEDLACFTKAQRDDFWNRIAQSPQAEIRIPFAELPPRLQERLRTKAEEAHEKWPEHSPSTDGIAKRDLIISRGGGYGSARLSGLPLQSRIAFFGLDGLGGIAGLGSVSADKAIDDFDRKTLQEAGVDTSFIKPLSPDFVDPESKTKRVKIKWPEEDEKKDAPVGFIVGGSASRASHSFEEVIEAASRMLRITIFAPDYICRHRNGYSWRTTFPEDAREAIEEICREFGYEVAYDKEDSTAIQCKTWYMEETRETPKRLVLRWADVRKKQGRLEFKDYLEIVGALDNSQIEALGSARIGKDTPLQDVAFDIGENADHLRLCSMLSADQTKRASGDGLAYRHMTRDQQRLFTWLLLNMRSDLTADVISGCLFSVRRDTQKQEGVEEGKPIKVEQDTVTFIYTFGPGDETQAKMRLEALVTRPETTAQ